MTPSNRRDRSGSIAAIAFVGGVGGGVVFPILPVIGLNMGISGFMVGLILSANRITRLGFNPITGSLLDRFGARWPVAAGLFIEALGTLAFSAALSFESPAAWFLVGRIIWGIGSSLLLVGALSAVMAIAPRERRGGMTARVRTAVSLGVPAGLVIGGLIADQSSANAAFLTATALSLAGAVAAVVVMPRRSAKVIEQQECGVAPKRSRGDDWRRLLRNPTLHIIWGVNALLFFAFAGVLLATLAVLVDTRHLYLFDLGAEGSAGLYMAALMAARAAASLASGRYLDRTRSRTRLLLPAMVLVAVGFAGLGQAYNLASMLPALFAIGLGSGALTIPMLTLLGDVVAPDLHGRALSVYQWSSDFGGALGPAVGLVFARLLGFGSTYAIVGLAMLGMAFPLFLLSRREK